MDGLESAAPAAPTPTPAPAPAPASAPAPAPAPAMPAESSSSEGGSIKDIVKDLNPTEIIFGILGAWALFSVIYYYRYNTTMNKAFKNEIENKIDDLNIKLGDITSVIERDKIASPTQSFEGFF